jgi:hypothetical protein
MPSMQDLAVGVLKRLGDTSIPKTDYYENVTAKVPENKAWAPNLPDLVLGQAPSTPAKSDLGNYPRINSAWSSITGQYPGAAGSSVMPMSMLQRLQGKVFSYLSGNPSDTVGAINQGTDVRFDPSLESKPPEEIRKTLLHEATHGAQRRNFPSQLGADLANYRVGKYWSSPGEQQAYEVERQDELKQLAQRYAKR